MANFVRRLAAVCGAGAKPKLAPHGPIVRMTTTISAVRLPAEVRVSVNNFLACVNSDFCNGTICRHVIPGFMLQGGGF